MRKINKIVVHHTGSRVLRGFDSPSLIRFRHKYFRGFEDIGYHYLIGNGILTRDGEVYNARPVEIEGAHAYGHNKDSIGIALIGNFNFREPTEKQLNSLIELLAKNCRGYGLNEEDIYGHRELDNANTSCPGEYIDMDELRGQVWRNMAIEDINFERHLHDVFYSVREKNGKKSN